MPVESDNLFSYLKKLAQGSEIAIGQELMPRCAILEAHWRRYGRAINLTASHSSEALAEHVFEAMHLVALARRIEAPIADWLDVGSGGGFPGLVLAACLDAPITLVEPRARRAAMLEIGLGALGRRDCRVVRARLSHGGCQVMEGSAISPSSFGYASARAVFSPEALAAELRPWLVDGGVYFAHVTPGAKGPEGVEVARIESRRWSVRAYRASEAARSGVERST